MRHGGKEDRANITLASDLVGKIVKVHWREKPTVCVDVLLAVDVRLGWFKLTGGWFSFDLVDAIVGPEVGLEAVDTC
jgi:hypothetical protein